MSKTEIPVIAVIIIMMINRSAALCLMITTACCLTLQRARHWAEKMDMMGFERLRLAAMLMDSLDSIEQESGLFLIKPMYSYRGR